MSDDAGATACLLILIALVLQVIGFVVLLIIALAFSFVPFLGGLLFVLDFLAFIWILLIYGFSYRPAANGEYEDARTPTLVFAILALVTGGIVTGILLLVAFVKLGDAVDTSEPVPWATYPPPGSYATQPMTPPPAPTPPVASPPGAPLTSRARYCPNCGVAVMPPGRYCHACGTTLG